MGAAGKQLQWAGMVGLNANLGALRRIGLRPLAAGSIGSIVVAAVGAGTIGLWMRP